MVKKRDNIFKTLLITLIISTLTVSSTDKTFAQTIRVSAAPDSTLLFIGGQMDFNLSVSQPKDVEVIFPQFSDTITEPIEIVESSGPDTTFLENEKIEVIKRYRITSFDSGIHYIPPLKFEYLEGQQTVTRESQANSLRVVNPFGEIDPDEGFFDIKSPLNVPFKISELLPYFTRGALILLILAIIAALVWSWIKKRNPVKEIFFKEKPKEPPHLTALRTLDKIKSEKLWQRGMIKEFHSQITDTLRQYLEERYNFPAKELTSGEIIKELKRIELPDSKLLNKTEQVLNTADLAKFAKYEPTPDENDFSLLSTYFFVNQTKEEPIQTAEEAAQESLRKEKGNTAKDRSKQ
ncbi:hypothetical protein QA597_08625 [Marinilabiliaceae bacterium ANBcel2]|nr:hypothetical protein [Marinilabiliaceae bacterium ANBcel2]